MNDQLYIPKNSVTLDQPTAIQQIRLGDQGYPGTGKTTSAATFPNTVFANFNRGLSGLQGRADIIEVPFYKMWKRTEVKDKWVDWLGDEGMKLKAEQTLVVDCLSDLHTYYHIWFSQNETSLAISRTGKVNEFIEWQLKTKYFDELNNLYLSLKCNVILLCHESERADKPTTVGQPGSYTGKIRPLITGQTGDVIIKDYTDWFRHHVVDKTKLLADITDERLKNWGCKNPPELKSLCEQFTGDAVYFWQTQGDDIFNAKASSLIAAPKFIPSTYNSFKQYMRK